MPVKSIAQLHKLFQLEAEGKIKKGTAREFADATPDLTNLPYHKKHSTTQKGKKSKSVV